MNIVNLVLSGNESRNAFLKRCLPLESWQEGNEETQEVKAILEKAETSEQFVDMVLNSDTMKGTQIYGELSKDRPGHWKRILNDISGWYETYSDAGGLKIGTDAFNIIIPNGYGDGKMHFTDVGKGCFNSHLLNFWTIVEGQEINIHDYDCSDSEIIKTLSGRYGVYQGYGFVVFEKWD